jgi:hypothetical protein
MDIDKSTISEAGLVLKGLTNHCNNLKKSLETWNVSDMDKSVKSFNESMNQMNEKSGLVVDAATTQSTTIRDFINSDEYKIRLDAALKNTGMPISGEFPQYEAIPFKLTINTDAMEARMAFGRKAQKTTTMNPEVLATWASAIYKKTVGKKFDTSVFMKDLLEAYLYANRLTFRDGEVLWGKAVPLELIYTLFSVKRSVRAEYSKIAFMYELGRLKENSDLSLEGYQFEFGFARNQSNSQGRESTISSLTIYKQ